MSSRSSSRKAFSGPVPKFFQSAPNAPEMVERLWHFANGMYLDNPIPSLFKERLCVYLSRFCEGRYCITRHSGFLIGFGHPSGDPSAPAETVAQVIKLLKTPPAWQRDMNAVLRPLEAISIPIDLPEPETDLEDRLFAAATVVFVEPMRCRRERAALRNAVGGQRFEHLMGLLTFMRAAHYWTMIHPDLDLDDDVRQMLDQHEELARLLLEDPEAARSEMGVRLYNELQILHDLNKQHELEKAKQVLEERDRQRELLLRTAQAELAHVTRVTMMGELTAAIVHEVVQPLAAVGANADVNRSGFVGGSDPCPSTSSGGWSDGEAEIMVRYAPEVRERAVRMVLEHAGDHASQWEAIGSIAAKIGCSGETLRKWVRQAERDRGVRSS